MNDLYKSIVDNLYDAVYFVSSDRKIIYWNHAAEELTGYTSDELIGQDCDANLLLHVDDVCNQLCFTNCPLEKTLRDGQKREEKLFLRHKNGQKIPVHIRIAPIKNSKQEKIGVVEIFCDLTGTEVIKQKLEELEKFALFDPLTSVANRRFLEMNLNAKMEEMRRYNWNFGLLFIDIDNFKMINDQYGHKTGDEILKLVTKTLVDSLRPFDLIGRIGGDEFVVLIENCNESGLLSVARRCGALVEKSSMTLNEGHLRVTLSIGGTLLKPDDTLETLLERADHLMYASKYMGKNKVTVK
ncbi:MAG: sensor domain-containing diguanylate cyclase [Spirochaetota bacterium]